MIPRPAVKNALFSLDENRAFRLLWRFRLRVLQDPASGAEQPAKQPADRLFGREGGEKIDQSQPRALRLASKSDTMRLPRTCGSVSTTMTPRPILPVSSLRKRMTFSEPKACGSTQW